MKIYIYSVINDFGYQLMCNDTHKSICYMQILLLLFHIVIFIIVVIIIIILLITINYITVNVMKSNERSIAIMQKSLIISLRLYKYSKFIVIEMSRFDDLFLKKPNRPLLACH